MPGAPLFRINGLGTVWVNAEVPESQAALRAARQRGRGAQPRRCPATHFNGTVQAILPEVNAATRTLQGARRARQSGRPAGAGHVRAPCSFAPARREGTLLVPTEAVIQTGKRTRRDAGRRRRPVPAGRRRDRHRSRRPDRDPRAAWRAGQQVVVSGAVPDRLRSEPARPWRRGSNACRQRRAARPRTARRRSDRGDRRATASRLSHGPIPSLKWGAMTMDFKLPPPGSCPRGVGAPAITVDFEFRMADDGPTCRRLTRHPRRRRIGSARHDRRAHPLVDRQPLPGAAGHACIVTAWGVWSVLRTPLDALPDLSDVQVIIRTTYPGQAPQIVENQVTYPLTTTMLSVPGREDGARLLVLRRFASSTSCSTTAPTCTGRARACSST